MYSIYIFNLLIYFNSFIINTTVPSEDSQSQINTASKPCLQVELENENSFSAKSIKISGNNKTSPRNVYNHIYI